MNGDLDKAVAAGADAIERAAASVAGLTARVDALRPAAELVLGCNGRVVVTGLGKSGLIGAKLAATLASTGTTAFFVHAADALHGDAGAVATGDVVLAISNSGETAEVLAFAELIKARGIAVIAMTGCGGGSSLCRSADVVLDIGVDREADPYDLVPTASTTAAAAMGDALAITLMVARGFGPDDFKEHHPGGALGRRLSDS